MDGEVDDVRVVPAEGLRPVAVVDVEVDDEDFLDREEPTSVGRSPVEPQVAARRELGAGGDDVQEAEAHRLPRARVVARRPDAAEGVGVAASDDRGARFHGAPHRHQGRAPARGVQVHVVLELLHHLGPVLPRRPARAARAPPTKPLTLPSSRLSPRTSACAPRGTPPPSPAARRSARTDPPTRAPSSPSRSRRDARAVPGAPHRRSRSAPPSACRTRTQPSVAPAVRTASP
mmetsp:Transcript_16916/g.52849  ORF Transcript_16916/g.52849 Transcript_16916/m.52849 type:complete len:232 (+) Transcript_16916:1055-1750(+)